MLLQQAQASLTPAEKQNGLDDAPDTGPVVDASRSQRFHSSLLPPKAPVSLQQLTPKQPPLRSLSWGSSPKPSPKSEQQPQRRSTFTALDASGHLTQQKFTHQKQPVQLPKDVQQWLSQEQISTNMSDAVDVHVVKQGVLQEVLQAMTLSSSAAGNVDFDNLTVKVHMALSSLYLI